MITPEQQRLIAASGGDLPALQAALDAGEHVLAQADAALCVAAEYGQVAAVKALLAAGADYSARDYSALRAAVRNGHLDVLECLITAGAAVYMVDDAALCAAAWAGHATVIRLLREHGVELYRHLEAIDMYPENVQVALFEAGDISDLSVTDLARQGVCPAALGALLERQGQPGLMAILAATQMLEPLTPQARADLLEEMLTNLEQPEIPHAR